jgi:hypothetical protein
MPLKLRNKNARECARGGKFLTIAAIKVKNRSAIQIHIIHVNANIIL